MSRFIGTIIEEDSMDELMTPLMTAKNGAYGLVLRRREEDKRFWVHGFRVDAPNVLYHGDECDSLTEGKMVFLDRFEQLLKETH
jgi:hypothetical protein